MDAQTGSVGERSIGDLFGQLAEDGKAFIRAEADLYKRIAKRRAGKAAGGAAALAAAFLLLSSALTALMVALVLALTLLIGPVLAGLAVFGAVGIVAFLLVRWGLGKLEALSGDEEERAALAAGERLS
jgi:hypothetical protein